MSRRVDARLPGAAGRRAPARRGRGARDRASTWSTGRPRTVSSCDRRPCVASGRPRPAAAPVRLVHLGLGNFFRAHQAWYTDHAPDARRVGHRRLHRAPPPSSPTRPRRPGRALHARHRGPPTGTASTSSPASSRGARRRRPRRLAATASRSPEVARRHAHDHRGRLPARRRTAGSTGRPGGGRATSPRCGATRRAPCARRPARLVAGLAGPPRAPTPGRSRSCPATTSRTTAPSLARVRPRPGRGGRPGARRLAGGQSVAIGDHDGRPDHPRTTAADRAPSPTATGVDDRLPGRHRAVQRVGARGAFPAGRPRWEDAGATLTDDVAPVRAAQAVAAQRRALAARLRRVAARARHRRRGGRRRRAAAAGSSSGGRGLAAPAPAGRRGRRLPRRPAASASPTRGCATALAQIAADGSQKLPVRILPVLAPERAPGRLPEVAVAVLAAWLAAPAGRGARRDVRADELSALGGRTAGRRRPRGARRPRPGARRRRRPRGGGAHAVRGPLRPAVSGGRPAGGHHRPRRGTTVAGTWSAPRRRRRVPARRSPLSCHPLRAGRRRRHDARRRGSLTTGRREPRPWPPRPCWRSTSSGRSPSRSTAH